MKGATKSLESRDARNLRRTRIGSQGHIFPLGNITTFSPNWQIRIHRRIHISRVHGSLVSQWNLTIRGALFGRSLYLAQLPKNRADYEGTAIQLLSCETGKLQNGFAQKLANQLNVPSWRQMKRRGPINSTKRETVAGSEQTWKVD